MTSMCGCSVEIAEEEHGFLVTMETPTAARQFNGYLLTEVRGDPEGQPFRIGCRMGEEQPTVLLYRDSAGLDAGDWLLLSIDSPVRRVAGDLTVTAGEMASITACIDLNRERLINHWLHCNDSRGLLRALRPLSDHHANGLTVR